MTLHVDGQRPGNRRELLLLGHAGDDPAACRNWPDVHRDSRRIHPIERRAPPGHARRDRLAVGQDYSICDDEIAGAETRIEAAGEAEAQEHAGAGADEADSLSAGSVGVRTGANDQQAIVAAKRLLQQSRFYGQTRYHTDAGQIPNSTRRSLCCVSR
jgi:hypothetical protein